MEKKRETHAPLQSSLARCQLAPETRPRCVNCCSRRGGLLGVGAHCRGTLSALRLHSPGLWRAAQNDVAGFNQKLISPALARQCSRGRCFRKCPSLTAAREKSEMQTREERGGQPSTLGIAKTPDNDPPANNGQLSELKTDYLVPPPASGPAKFVAAAHLRAAVIGFWKYDNTGHSPQCRSPHTRTALHMTAAPNGHHPTSTSTRTSISPRSLSPWTPA